MDCLKRRPSRGRVVAVTGARTFLGRNLVALLEEDPAVSKVVVLDIRNAPTAGPKTCFYQVDLTQPGVESRLSEVLHAEEVASLAHLAFAETPTQAFAWAHELERIGTMNVLSACRQRALPHLVVCTTTLSYGPHANNPNHLGEDTPLRGMRGSAFVADKIDVEQQLASFVETQSDSTVTVLRMAPILGPNVQSYAARWLSGTFVPVVLGHDPLVQFLHEVDAVAALKLALDVRVPGVFNIVGEGVLPVSTVLLMAGRIAIPWPLGLLVRLTRLLWVTQLSDAPSEFVYLLRYLCVADGAKARAVLGFKPAYSTGDAVLDFEGALRLRDAQLLEGTV